MNKNKCFVIMGVAGAGKTTVGSNISKKTKSYFLEGDNFHNDKNIQKMKSGIPLNDKDRLDWLNKIKEEITLRIKDNNVIVACSALKEKYRKILNLNENAFIYLKIDKKTANIRLKNRKNHFMPRSLVESQFSILEEPKRSIICDGNQDMEEIIKTLINQMNLK